MEKRINKGTQGETARKIPLISRARRLELEESEKREEESRKMLFDDESEEDTEEDTEVEDTNVSSDDDEVIVNEQEQTATEEGGSIEEEDDFLDFIIPVMESIKSGIYSSKISSIKKVKNGKLMFKFDIRSSRGSLYSVFNFYEMTAIRGNPLHRLLKAFQEEEITYRDLIGRPLYISIKRNEKDGKIYENIVDFASKDRFDKKDLRVDDYGRFIF